MSTTESAERCEVDPAATWYPVECVHGFDACPKCGDGPTRPDQRTPARADADPAVELVARRLATTVKRAGLAPIPQLQDALFTALAEDAIDALAGRLLPPVVQTREEKGFKVEPGGEMLAWSDYVESQVGTPTHVRTISTFADDGSPYGGATLTGKWRNADE